MRTPPVRRPSLCLSDRSYRLLIPCVSRASSEADTALAAALVHRKGRYAYALHAPIPRYHLSFTHIL